MSLRPTRRARGRRTATASGTGCPSGSVEGVLGLEAQLLVGDAVLVAGLDELLAPTAGRLRARAWRRPCAPGSRTGAKPVVEDAARVAGAAVDVVGDGHRRDRREVRRPRAGDEELA